MAMLETSDDGMLHVPPELIGGPGAHAKFEIETLGSTLLLRLIDKEYPFWRRATPQQRAEAFLRWAESPRPPALDLADETLRRENLYD